MKMKSLIALGLLVCSTVTLASHVADLKINLQNNGSSVCSKSKVVHVCGTLKEGSVIPENLPADASVQSFVVNGGQCPDKTSDTILEYDCGLGKMFRVELTSGIRWHKERKGFVTYNVMYPETKDVFPLIKILERPYYKNGWRRVRHGGEIMIILGH